MNKKIIFIALALALPLTVAAFPGSSNGDHFDDRRGDKVERMAKQLDLNAEQKSKLEVIFKEQQEKREAIRQKSRLRIQEVLSSEQMTKLDDLKKNHQEKWQKRHEQRKNIKQNKSQD